MDNWGTTIPYARRTWWRALTALVLGALAMAVAGATPAAADTVLPGADLHIAQTLGDRELTVVIRRVEPVPGPLPVDVVTHQGTPGGPITVRAAHDGAVTSSATVLLGPTPGVYSGTLRVDRPGAWELWLDDGVRVARMSFVVPANRPAPWEQATYGGFLAAGLLLLTTLVVAVRARRSWTALVPGAGVVAALAVAITAALLSATIPPPPVPGALLDPTDDTVDHPYPDPSMSTVDYSRPPVNLVARADSARSGTATDVRLELTDGATGRPVDDLLPHHGAFLHLVVLGPDGRMWHLHPIRTDAGVYLAHLRPPEPGRYVLAAELARRGGGIQLVRTAVTVTPGDSTPSDPVPSPGPGVLDVDGSKVDVRTELAPAGTPSTITATFPAADLQPWLGMLGHLIVVGPFPAAPTDPDAALTAPVWAHVHAMLPLPPGASAIVPDETVAAFGPDVRFTFTFPLPGRYRFWVQSERNFHVLTVPGVVDVPAANGAGR